MLGGQNIAQRITLDGADDIRRDLSDLARAAQESLGNLAKGFSNASDQLAQLGKTTTDAPKPFQQLQDRLRSVKEGLDPLRESAAQFGESIKQVGENIIPHFGEALRLAVAGGLLGLIALTKEAAESVHRFGELAEQVGLTPQVFDTLRRTAANFGIDTEQLAGGLAHLSRATQDAREQQKTYIVELAKMSVGPTAQVGDIVARGIEKAGDAAQRSKGFITNITDNWKAAGDAAKLSLDTFRAADPTLTLQQVQQKLYQMMQGTSEQAQKTRETIAKIGVSVPALTQFEALNRLLPDFTSRLARLVPADILQKGDPQEILQAVATAFNKLTTNQDRAALASQLFGRDFRQWVPFLEHVGEVSIPELQHAFELMGVQLASGDAKKAADAQVHAWNELSFAFAGVKNAALLALGQALLPVLKDLAEWLNTHKAEVTSFFKTVGENIKAFIGAFGSEGEGAKTPKSYLDEIWAALNRIGNIVGVLGVKGLIFVAWIGYITGTWTALGKLVSLFATLLRLGTAAALSNPWILLVAAVAAAVAAIIIYRNEIWAAIVQLGQQIAAVWTQVWLAVQSIWAAIVQTINNAVQAVVNFFVQAWNWVAQFFAGIAEGIKQAWTAVTTWISDKIQAAIAAFGQAWNWVAQFFAGIVAGIKQGWSDVTTWVNNQIQAVIDFFVQAWNWVAQYFTGILDGIKQAWSDFTTWISDKINAMIGLVASLSDAAAQAASAVSGLGDAASGANAAAGFASGGRVRGPAGTDRVPIWATAGEWVMSLRAVRKYGPGFMHAVNTGQFPGRMVSSFADGLAGALVPKSHFAEGGPVLAAAGDDGRRIAVDLTVAGQTFADLLAPAAVADRMVAFARTAQVKSAGRKPGWAR